MIVEREMVWQEKYGVAVVRLLRAEKPEEQDCAVRYWNGQWTETHSWAAGTAYARLVREQDRFHRLSLESQLSGAV